MLKTKIVVKA